MADTPPTQRYPRTIRLTHRVEIPLETKRRRRPSIGLDSLPLLLVGGFGVAIAIGTILLMLPLATEDRTWTSPITALFVSTSAVCVTGLVPVDTGPYWSGFGEAVILALIQFGGLGFMTSTTLLFLLLGWRVGVRERLFLSATFDLSRPGGVVRIARRAIIFTLILESAGFVLLTLRFLLDRSLLDAVWMGLFHSVSAFNNAGFDLFGGFRSLEAQRDAFTLVVIGVLVVFGGIGYVVVEDLLHRRRNQLTLDSTLVLRTTAILIVVGWVGFLLLEWNSTLDGLTGPDRIVQSWFHAVAPRTAGFASLPVAEMSEETQFVTMLLMFIGGGSGSTAGGIKVATFAILVVAVLSTIRGKERIEVAGREIRRSEADKAFAVAALGALVVVIVTVLLAIIEDKPFLWLFFEATSAFGTTGLSTGITPALSDYSLVLLSLTMFVGRLGPLTLALVLLQRAKPQRIRLPEERVRIG